MGKSEEEKIIAVKDGEIADLKKSIESWEKTFDREKIRADENGKKLDLERGRGKELEARLAAREAELGEAWRKIEKYKIEIANEVCSKISIDKSLSEVRSPVLWLKTPGHGLLDSAAFCRIRDAIRRYSPAVGFIMMTGPEIKSDLYTDAELAQRGLIRITGKNPGFDKEEVFLAHCKAMYDIRKPMGFNTEIEGYENVRDPDGVVDREKK